MAFPSSSAAPNLASALIQAMNAAANVKSRTVSLSVASSSGPVSAGQILDYVTFLADAKLVFTSVSQVSGIAAYAQAQLGNPGLDIAAEFTSMTTALDSVIGWVQTNFPKNGGGFLLAFTMNAQGRTVFRTFTTADLATFRTQLDSLAATIA